jgi:hypothetical protein
MAGHESSRPEQIRALIEEVDRICDESERVIRHVEWTMKHPFWPDRRRTARVPPPSPKPPDRNSDDTT